MSSDLRAVLEMRRTDPTGHPLPPDAYVFGNAVGDPLTSIKTAWRNTCRRAGITDLHFHDLRREFPCRLLESSADLHDVRDFLGHANITTTSRYLRSTPVRLAQALERMEAAAETVVDADDVWTAHLKDDAGNMGVPSRAGCGRGCPAPTLFRL